MCVCVCGGGGVEGEGGGEVEKTLSAKTFSFDNLHVFTLLIFIRCTFWLQTITYFSRYQVFSRPKPKFWCDIM